MGADGPAKWKELHDYTVAYPAAPGFADRLRAKAWLQTYANGLVCSICRTHAKAYIKEYPPNLADRMSFAMWGWMFHNMVNIRLGKSSITFSQFKRMYNL